MSWLCLWTDILDCPKLAELDDSTIGGWVLILAAVKRHDQDGRVPEIKRLAHWCRRPEMTLRAWISKLEDVGLLDERDGETVVHDWNDWQYRSPGPKPTGEAKSDAERSRSYRERQKAARHGVTAVTVPLDSSNTTRHNTTGQGNHVTSQMASRDHPRDAPRPTFEIDSLEWKNQQCIDQATRHWGASNGDSLINELLRIFHPDIVMAAMDACFDKFKTEFKPAYLRKCCEGKFNDHARTNGKV